MRAGICVCGFTCKFQTYGLSGVALCKRALCERVSHIDIRFLVVVAIHRVESLETACSEHALLDGRRHIFEHDFDAFAIVVHRVFVDDDIGVFVNAVALDVKLFGFVDDEEQRDIDDVVGVDFRTRKRIAFLGDEELVRGDKRLRTLARCKRNAAYAEIFGVVVLFGYRHVALEKRNDACRNDDVTFAVDIVDIDDRNERAIVYCDGILCRRAVNLRRVAVVDEICDAVVESLRTGERERVENDASNALFGAVVVCVCNESYVIGCKHKIRGQIVKVRAVVEHVGLSVVCFADTDEILG